jgi:hypothetical protein
LAITIFDPFGRASRKIVDYGKAYHPEGIDARCSSFPNYSRPGGQLANAPKTKRDRRPKPIIGAPVWGDTMSEKSSASTPRDQVNDHQNNSDHQQDVNQSARNMTYEAKQPKND